MSNGISKSTLGTIGAGIGGVAIGGALGFVAGRKSRSKKRRRRKVAKRSYRKSRRKHYKGRKTPHTAGKRKDRSHKRIRYTKNGQPYIIMGNGRARFISKKGAKMSRKRRGGRY